VNIKRSTTALVPVLAGTLLLAGLSTAQARVAIVPTVASTPCTSVSATATPASDTGPGITVAITGSASGCPNPLYKFWILYPGSSTWRLAQSYSANSATFKWDTSSKPPGVYSFSIWARDAGSPGTSHNSLGTWDAYSTLKYTLPVWPFTPCTGLAVVSATPPSFIALSGTPVTMTFGTSGCPTPRYEYWMFPPGSTGWQLVQGYGSSPTFNWDTTGMPAGFYGFRVLALDASSPGINTGALGTWDVSFDTGVRLTTQPCDSVSASSSPESHAAAGTPVTITGFAFGCPGPRYEFWILNSGSSTWQLAQTYSSSATYSWNTTGKAAGVYHFSVWARDASSGGKAGDSLGTWDAYTAIVYTLT
jgi:hypothetical protein